MCELKKNILFILLSAFFASFNSLYAQDDTLRNNTLTYIGDDTLATQSYVYDAKIHSPERAAMLSAAVPGLGQIYNKKYWKLPFIYGGAITLIYFINYNNNKYKLFRDGYYEAKIGGTYTPEILKEFPKLIGETPNANVVAQFEAFKEDHRRYREYCIFSLIGLYIANILDANIDAYFINFDVSKDLTVQIKPYVDNSLLSENIIGLKLSLDYK